MAENGIASVLVKANLLWLLGTYLMHTMGELCLSPIGLSMVSKLSPVTLASLMMGVWMLSSFFANITAGFIASFFVSLGAMSIFAVIAVTSILLGLFLFGSQQMAYRENARGEIV
ncbi:MAG: hypothetical protein V8R52_03465 [Coprobacter fastidiosus]